MARGADKRDVIKMSESQGWIKLHRKLLENPLCKSPAWGWLWVCLLLLANHDEASFIWNGKAIRLKSGQFLTGRKRLAEMSGVSESLVEKILNYLETEQQIEQQKTTKYRVITILKWNQYQEKDSKSNNSVTTARQQRNTYKNDKNEKKYNTAAKAAGEMHTKGTIPIRELLEKHKPDLLRRSFVKDVDNPFA